MELSQLQSFTVLARTRNFRQAAEKLHISQPSLSQQIGRLERELGVQLFDRAHRPVQLTEAAEVLARGAVRLLAELDELVAEVKDFDASTAGSVSVGAMQYLVHLELPEILATFRTNHPAAELHLRTGTTGEVRAMLLTGEVSIGLLHQEAEAFPQRFALEPLRVDELVVILSHHDEMARRGHVEWADLAQVPFVTFRAGASIHAALRQGAQQAGFELRTTLESADMSAAIALVERGLGAALVPAALATSVRDRVAAVTVGDRRLRRTVTLVWDREAYQSRSVQEFMQIARRVSRAVGDASPSRPARQRRNQ